MVNFGYGQISPDSSDKPSKISNMFSIENIGIAFIVSGIISYFLYYVTTQIKKGYLGMPGFMGLGILFILLSYQTYKFMGAWDEKTMIEETMEGINDWADDAIDFVDELDRQNGGNGETGKHIKDAMNNPLIQKGLSLFGIDVGMNGKMTIEMAEKLKTKYNWYMFRRVCWMLGFMLLYGIFVTIIPASDTTGNNRSSHSANRGSRRPSSRNNGYHSRRR